MRPPALPPILDFENGRLLEAHQLRLQKKLIAVIKRKQEMLAKLSNRWKHRRAVTCAELAGLYARLYMYGRALEMYEHSLVESELVMVRIKLAWLLVCLLGEDGFAQARELASGCSSAGASNGWIGTMVEQVIHEKLRAIERGRYKSALENQKPGVKPLVGISDAILKVCRSVITYADSRLPILLTGATGTGKEVVACALHACSPRASQPFVAFNCSCLSADLAARELFGHVKGAFTGADRAQSGYFAAANGGTLFLDEVGDLPLAVQPQLLRVLSTGEFYPVGSTALCRVNVRVIAATNQDLEAMAAEGSFREDLYFRLAGCKLALPPLNDRRGDVPLLAQYFLDKYDAAQHMEQDPGNDTGQTAQRIPRHAVWAWAKRNYLMTQYPFAGNVRELEYAVQHDAINDVLRRGDEVPFPAMMQLPTPIAVYKRPKPEGNDIGISLAPMCYTRQELAAFDLRIAARLCDTQEGMAKLLGTTGSTISRRLKPLGLNKRRTTPLPST
jgi:transcriptional regulator with GAF, ATPase, and Fis domain